MKRRFSLAGSFLVGLLLSPPIAAESQINIDAGVSLLQFGYQEFDGDNVLLDEEYGLLPGIILAASIQRPKWYGKLSFIYHFGEVRYDGHTQSMNPQLSGLPLNSRTDTDVSDTTLVFGRKLMTPSLREYELYGGLGYHYWLRSIRSSQTADNTAVAGVLEEYEWLYALLGAKVQLIETSKHAVHIDLRMKRMLWARMEVDFQGYGGYDNAHLDLGEGWGYQLSLPWRFVLGKDSSFITEPYYASWDLHRSKAERITVNGSPINAWVVEPRSETRNYGISFYLNKVF